MTNPRTLGSFVSASSSALPSSATHARDKLSLDRANAPSSLDRPNVRPSDDGGSGRSSAGLPSADPPTRRQYAKTGYDFVERIRVAGPRGTLGTLPPALVLSAVIGAAVVLYGVYYLTTFSFVLTTDPSPQRNTMFQRFPSDYAVMVNKWTGRRRVVQVEPAAEETRHPDGTLPYRERVIHVNRLKDRLVVYQQPTRATIVVETEPILAADRFVKVKDRASRASVAVRRTDQLFPDPQEQGLEQEGAGASGSASPPRLVVETEMRMRDIKNGSAQGNILAFRETVRHVIEDKLLTRCYDALLLRTMSGGTKRVYSEEMIRNGAVTAKDISLEQLVPDLAKFADEVFAEVTRRMGDDVLLYRYKVRVL